MLLHPTEHQVPVALRGVSKRFGDATVVDDLTLDVHGAEMLALLGPSGCGKSTTLRMIAGFERADRGTIHIGDRDVTTLPARKRGVGIVFQAYSLFPHMTARANVEYGLRVAGIRGVTRAKRSAELLEIVGLEEHGTKYPHQLSGGQQQRVALARALAVDPQVLLLDEPLSALDAIVRTRLRDEIRRIQREMGTTMVIVTHDQEEALSIADRVAVMHGGRIEQIASPHEVYTRPATEFVADFVGATNRLTFQRIEGQPTLFGSFIDFEVRTHPVSGDEVVFVRPELLSLHADPSGDAMIESIMLRGPITTAMVRHASQPDLIRVDLATGAHHPLRQGDPVTVTFTAVPRTPSASPQEMELV